MVEEGKNSTFGGLSKNVLSLGWVSFLTDVSSEMIYPLLPLFLTRVLGASMAFVGVVEGVAESTASLLKLVSGWLSDRLNRRKGIVLIGYTLSTLTRPLIALATLPFHVLVVRFFDRVGKGIRSSPRDALISLCCPSGSRGKAFGFQRAMDHAGAVIGPLVSFILLATFTSNYRTIFWLAFIPGIISLLLIIFGVKEIKVENPCLSSFSFSLAPFDQRFKTFLLILVIFTLGNSSDAFLILRAKDLGISLPFIPLLWLLLHGVKSLSSFPAGILSDRKGRKKVIIGGWLVYTLVYLGFALASKPIHILGLFAIYGFFFGLTEGAEKALVADLVPLERQGTAYGIYNFALGLASFPASLIFGLLWQIFGVRIAFFWGAALALTASLFLGKFLTLKAD